MFAPIILGGLGIFLAVTGFYKTEASLYLTTFSTVLNKYPRRNTKMFQDQNPRVFEVNFIPNNCFDVVIVLLFYSLLLPRPKHGFFCWFISSFLS
jgi:hypothetical protein